MEQGLAAVGALPAGTALWVWHRGCDGVLARRYSTACCRRDQLATYTAAAYLHRFYRTKSLVRNDPFVSNRPASALIPACPLSPYAAAPACVKAASIACRLLC